MTESNHTIETFKSMISIATEALKALQLLNGGAIVALLAYLGRSPSPQALSARMVLPFSFFVLGLVAATGAFGTAYLTQFALYNEDGNRKGYWDVRHQVWLKVTAAIALSSLIFFGAGAFWSLCALARR